MVADLLKDSINKLVDRGWDRVHTVLPTLRSVFYILEGLPIQQISRLVSGIQMPPPTNEELRTLLKETFLIHERDHKNIVDGYYPRAAQDFESPVDHVKTLIDVLWDGTKVAWRMRQKNHRDFSEETLREYSNLPDYYLRNFHFQSDGYLSDASAKRYEHQVEILFAGTAGAMRRELIPHLKNRLGGREPSQILDLAAGPGTSTKPLAMAFETARITAVDLSEPYLQFARERFSHLKNIDWVAGDATQLKYPDHHFDCVCSTYLFHELPREVRMQVLAEAYRVLKPGGVLAIADSLQWDSDSRFNWALERFPVVYHEPFYKNYLMVPLEPLFKEAGFKDVKSYTSLLTKYVVAEK